MLLIFDLDDTLFPGLPVDYKEEEVEKIQPYPLVREILQRKDCKKVLVSWGDPEFQHRKLEVLGVRHLFDKILISSSGEGKKECMKEAMKSFPEKEVWVIGDRLEFEIRFGNELGLKTVHLKRGKYGAMKPEHPSEVPKYEVQDFSEFLNLINCKHSTVLK